MQEIVLKSDRGDIVVDVDGSVSSYLCEERVREMDW